MFVCVAEERNYMVTSLSFIQIHEHLFLAFYEETQATKMARHALNAKYLVVPCVHIVEIHGIEPFVPSPLQEIYNFDELANQVSRRSTGLRLVFCAGLDPVLQARVTFLLGCHMVISLGMDPSAVHVIFQKAVNIGSGQLDGWRALKSVKTMGWINFQDPFQTDDDDQKTIHMDEYIHYCRSQHTMIATIALAAQE